MTTQTRRVHVYIWRSMKVQEVLLVAQAVPSAVVQPTETPAQTAHKLCAQFGVTPTNSGLKFFCCEHWLSQDNSKDLYATLALEDATTRRPAPSVAATMEYTPYALAVRALDDRQAPQLLAAGLYAQTNKLDCPHVAEEFVPQSSSTRKGAA